MAIFNTDRSYKSRLIVTGANGGIGHQIRGKLGHMADEIILSDLDHVPTGENEQSAPCDLTDLSSVRALLKGGGDVLHFGGQSVEAPFERINEANIIGTYNLYEAARLEGVRRVLFASSNHAIGFHARETILDADSPTRPDSLYGVSKVYGEALARFYYDKFGIETLILRIGSCLPKPRDRRMMYTWMSAADMIRLCERMIKTSRLGCPIVYGQSDNLEKMWDNSKTAFIGWHPQDSSEPFRAEIEAVHPMPDPESTAVKYQGGVFVSAGHPGTFKSEAEDN